MIIQKGVHFFSHFEFLIFFISSIFLFFCFIHEKNQDLPLLLVLSPVSYFIFNFIILFLFYLNKTGFSVVDQFDTQPFSQQLIILESLG